MRRLLPLLFALALLAPACGGKLQAEIQRGRIVLDGPPSAVHAGIVLAVGRDFDRGEGVELRIRPPSDGTTPVRMLETGRADLAVADIADVGAAQSRGSDVVGVSAIVQAPLVAVLSDVRRPRALEGKPVGYTTPRDLAVLRAVVEGDGGDFERVDAVPSESPLYAMKAGDLKAFVGRLDLGVGPKPLRPDDYGAPTFPQLVLATTRTTLQEKPALVRGAIRAIRRGYDEAVRDPELAVETLIRRTPANDRAALAEQFTAVAPAFTAGNRPFGELDPAVLADWADWATKYGLLARKPNIGAAFVTTAG